MTATGDGTVTDRLQASGLLDLGKGFTSEDIKSSLENLSKLAIGLKPLDVILLRQGAVDTLKDKKKVGIGSRDATDLVNAALPKKGQEKDKSKELQGHAIVFTDPEPWPDPVTGVEVLKELVETLTQYVALREGAATTIALWILFAHAHDAFQISPILAITSPEMRCGKTTLLELISALVPRSLPSSSITVAVLFRAVDRFEPTLLIDEADTFLKDRDELRGIMNSGHRRSMATVLRTAGDEYEVRAFSTWAPKAVALIGKLPGTLTDRSIEVRMRRRSDDEHVERLRRDRLGELEPLRQRLWAWAQENLEKLRVADPSLPDGLHDRARDNWRQLVSIADLAGGVWPERSRKAALLLSGQNTGDGESLSTLLLGDIRELFKKADTDRLQSAKIAEGLARREDRPWPEYRKGSPITTRQVAQLLKRFPIKPRAISFDGKTLQGYELKDFKDAFKRYLPSPGPQGPQGSNNDAKNSGSSIHKADPVLADREGGERPVNTKGLVDLVDRNTPPAGNTRPSGLKKKATREIVEGGV